MKLELSSGWKLKCADLSCGIDQVAEILKYDDNWLDIEMPCDVRIPLIEKGMIKDPVLADHCYKSEWIEDRSWWFVNRFDVSSEVLKHSNFELVCESLDLEADIFLNDRYLGHHRNAFRPFCADLKDLLIPINNVLVIRLTTGVERYSFSDIVGIQKSVNTEAVRNRSERGDIRRSYLRKPQYCFGWDWCPRVVSCGIMAPVYIRANRTIGIHRLKCVTTSVSDPVEIFFEVEVENFEPFSTVAVDLSLHLFLDNREVYSNKNNYILKSGLNYIKMPARISEPKLWWPNGIGDQVLYKAMLTASINENLCDTFNTKFGIRTVVLDMERYSHTESGFAFLINGVKIFCKGSNWIPADSIYARVSDEKYTTLIKEAVECNFNMLRVWGGGLYERDVFYELCDAYGLLVWQDFMFACSVYPDVLGWFRQEVELEMFYQTRRLSSHPCIALWCGNNENAQCFDELWTEENAPAYLGGVISSNHIAPRIVHENCPEIPYWNSSPYGGEFPNSNNMGDKHFWSESMMSKNMATRITPEVYDSVTAKFISEFGYPGPCAKQSIEKYLDGATLERESILWVHHNNTFEEHTVDAGITKHYSDAEHLGIDEYLLFASLCQGMMLNYSLEALLANEQCSGALYWMYNDCWGETGWTTIDYYLIRKPSYYFVKRTLNPIHFILRAEGGTVIVTGINDTRKNLAVDIEYGYRSFDGKVNNTNKCCIEMLPFSRKVVFSYRMGDYNTFIGCYFVKPVNEGLHLNTSILRTTENRNLLFPKAKLTLSRVSREQGAVSFFVSSDVFAHAVHFRLPPQILLSDSYFDLLPGEEKQITAKNLPEEFELDESYCVCG